jgi:hypothetical protein
VHEPTRLTHIKAQSWTSRLLASTNHLGDPDRCVGRRAARGCRVVDEDSGPLANPGCSLAKFWTMNANLGEASWPTVSGQAEAVSVLDDPFGCQAPASATDEVVAVLPAKTQFLGVRPGFTTFTMNQSRSLGERMSRIVELCRGAADRAAALAIVVQMVAAQAGRMQREEAADE